MNLEHRRFDSSDQTHEARVELPVEGDGGQIRRPENLLEFSKDEFVVYPAHGVGQIQGIEVQTVAGASLEFFVIHFAKSRMKARVPTQKAVRIGIRKLSSPGAIKQVRRTLSQAALKARINWARLTKEYESKLKSGDIVALAEVMRDLHRRPAESEQSYSERQFYATALDRLSGEVALVEQITEEKAALELEGLLMGRPGRTPHGRC
ncbi:CarD family transcriptional regulator [Bradyrhizobium sp.]|jgi:CarD family transcriptional regulator|uniref:CarD family transcriptional regulator n=1 Tax=Bradyrhizobium sp. TaxID=376 RepID=UPI003C40CCBD